jgi:hypothetical protein
MSTIIRTVRVGDSSRGSRPMATNGSGADHAPRSGTSHTTIRTQVALRDLAGILCRLRAMWSTQSSPTVWCVGIIRLKRSRSVVSGAQTVPRLARTGDTDVPVVVDVVVLRSSDAVTHTCMHYTQTYTQTYTHVHYTHVHYTHVSWCTWSWCQCRRQSSHRSVRQRQGNGNGSARRCRRSAVGGRSSS